MLPARKYWAIFFMTSLLRNHFFAHFAQPKNSPKIYTIGSEISRRTKNKKELHAKNEALRNYWPFSKTSIFPKLRKNTTKIK